MPDTRHSGDLRVAVIGYGLAGSVFHAPFVSATPGLQLAAVVTGNPERQAKVRRDYPTVRVIDTAERLWDEANNFDLAVVGAPNGTHVSLATAALAAGLNVVVDKPFAATSAEGRGVIDAATRAGKLVIPFHNRRWDGDMLTVRRLIADGSLGDVWRFESKFERWRGAPKERWCIPEARALGEGMLHDIATHLIDQALVLFGPVRSVYAELDARYPGVTTEDDALVCLTHENGVRSRVWPSAVSGQSGPRFAVYGSRGTYLKYGLDVQEDAMKAGEGPPTRADWGAEPEERWGTLGLGNERTIVRTENGDYKHFYAGVARAIRDGAPPPVLAEDAVTGLAIIEAAIRSSEEGCAVSL